MTVAIPAPVQAPTVPATVIFLVPAGTATLEPVTEAFLISFTAVAPSHDTAV